MGGLFDLSVLNKSSKKKLMELKKEMLVRASEFKPSLTPEQQTVYNKHLQFVYDRALTDLEKAMKELMGNMGMGGMI